MSSSDSDSSSASSGSTVPKITASPSATKNKSSGSKTKTKNSLTEQNHDSSLWAYQPPEGMVLISDPQDNGNGEDWDWDTFNERDSELELWLIRVPNGIKPKHLENLTIDLPNSSSTSNQKIGVLNRKHENYDIWNLGVGSSSSSSNEVVGGIEVQSEHVEAAASIGGEEMKGITCLLPRKKSKDPKKRGFYIAPRPISRHLIVAAQLPKPSPQEGSSSIPAQNPPRFAYPPDLLSHRFVAFGSSAEAKNVDHDDEDDDKMDVDLPEKVKEKEPKPSSKSKVKDIITVSPSVKTSKPKSKETKKRNLDTDEVEADTEIQPSQKKQKKSKK